MISMDERQTESLCAYVEDHVTAAGCDHTHRFARDWANENGIDWDDLLDLLEANGSFCDCEVFYNLPGRDLTEVGDDAPKVIVGTAWLLPSDYEVARSATFSKVIVCDAQLGRNTHARDGEILIPAPRGSKPRGRVRKSVNHFVGRDSGLPSEVAVVRETDALSADEFAHRARASGHPELRSFGYREAGFVLSRIAKLAPSTPVGTDFVERVGIASRHDELTVHRVFMRR